MTQSWRRFGRYDVLPLLDGRFEVDSDVLIHARSEAARDEAIRTCGPKIVVDVNCFALRSADGLMLVDAGVGSAWGPRFGYARIAMREAGIGPEGVDRVLLTHIHGDHALGLFEDAEAYFPHAEILVPEVDLAFFTDPESEAATPEPRRGGFAVAKTLSALYAGRLRPLPTGSIMPDIEARALPGHTPGHVGYLIGAREHALLIWADALHLADMQTRDPNLGLRFDLDPDEAVRTRKTLLAEAASAGWTVAGSHVSGLGQIISDQDHYRFESLR